MGRYHPRLTATLEHRRHSTHGALSVVTVTVLELGETELPDQAKQETLQEGGWGWGGWGWSERGSKTSSHRDDATLPATEGRLWYGRAAVLSTRATVPGLPLLQTAR